MRIIDTHVNVTKSGYWINNNYYACFNDLEEQLDRSNVAKAILVTLPFYGNNLYTAEIVNKEPNRFKGLGYIDFTKSSLEEQINDIFSLNLSGIKFHPRIQGINLCRSELDYMWEYLNDQSAVVLIDGYYQLTNKNVLISDLYPLSYEKHIRKYSNIKFILAHSGFHKVMDTFFLCRSYPNFFANLSFSLSFIHKTSFYKDYQFFIEMCDRKILFGSDFPEIKISEAISQFLVLSSKLPKEKKRNILYSNADKLFWNKHERD